MQTTCTESMLPISLEELNIQIFVLCINKDNVVLCHAKLLLVFETPTDMQNKLLDLKRYGLVFYFVLFIYLLINLFFYKLPF